MARYAVMFSNNRYFKDDCILWNPWGFTDSEKEKQRAKLLEDSSTNDINEARIFNSIQSIISACGAGGYAKSRGDFSIIKISIVSEGIDDG